MLYSTSFKIAVALLTIAKFTTYFTASSCSIYFHKTVSVFPCHLAHTDDFLIRKEELFSFLTDILPAANFTGKHIWNGIEHIFFLTSLLLHELQKSSALQRSLFQQTYPLFLRSLLITQTQYRSMDKVFEEISR